MNPVVQCYWVNIHPNLGDLVCCPAFYFESLQPYKRLSYNHDPISCINEYPTIIGGGGMLFPGVDENVKIALNYHRQSIVLWGIGLNYSDRPAQYPDWISQFDLVGLRDYRNPFQYVPCVSCMAKEFDRKYEIKHDVSFYGWDNPFKNDKAIPYMTPITQTDSFERAIQFLAESNAVISSSYHGAYWAMLLNRIVILWEPTSLKFFLFEKQPMICCRDNWKHIIKMAHLLFETEEYLSKCRMRNVQFCANALEVLKIK